MCSTTDEYTSVSSCYSSSEDALPFKSVNASRGGAGDGPTKKIRLHDNKSNRFSHLRDRRCLKKQRKTTNLNGNTNFNSDGQKIVTKIPRPSSSIECPIVEKENKNKDCSLIPVRHTKLILNNFEKDFKKRKSLSQMDMHHLRNLTRHCRELVPQSYTLKPIIKTNNQSDGDVENNTQQDANQSMALNEEFYKYIRNCDKDEIDSRTAGMRIFATIMLNAWRKRREDVKRLTEEASRARKSASKVKTQIHVLNSLFKIEQKQNDDLNVRMRRMIEDQRKIQDLYDELNTSYIELSKSNTDLHDCIAAKESEIEGLEMVLKETKAHVFKLMANEREIESVLSCEQRKVQELENNKNELITTINELEDELSEKEIRYTECVHKNDEEIGNLKEQLGSLEQRLIELESNEAIIEEYQRLNESQKSEITELKKLITKLKSDIDLYLPNRLKKAFSSNVLPQRTLEIAHIVAYYMLPAMPPPNIKTFPAVFSIEKAISFVRKY